MWAAITAIVNIIALIFKQWIEWDKAKKEKIKEQKNDLKEAFKEPDKVVRASRLSAINTRIRLRE